jgi:hypothetical protein
MGMERSKIINREIPSPSREQGTLNELYSNPGLFAEHMKGRRRCGKLMPFIVEWQMINTELEQ